MYSNSGRFIGSSLGLDEAPVLGDLLSTPANNYKTSKKSLNSVDIEVYYLNVVQ